MGRAGRLGTLTAAALSVTLLGACSGGSADTADSTATKAQPTATATVTKLDSQKGSTLNDARDVAEAAGYVASSHNANGGNAEPSGSWRVCFETVHDNTVDFGAVHEGALCPAKDGGPLTWPKAPDATGTSYAKAVSALTKAGLDEDNISTDSAYEDVSVSFADVENSPDRYIVCFQSLTAGADIKPASKTTLSLIKGDSCPSKKGTYKDKTNDPDYSLPSEPTADNDSGSSTGGGATSPSEWNGQCELTSPAGNDSVAELPAGVRDGPA